MNDLSLKNSPRPPETRINELDRKILSLLDSNCRVNTLTIAEHLNISRQTANYRINKLKEAGVIIGNLTIFDTGVLGYSWYRVLIRMLNVSQKQKNDFLEFLSKHPQATWLGEVGGRWDVVVNFACKNPVDFNNLSEALSVKYGSLIKEMDVLVYVDIYDYSRSYLDSAHSKKKEFFHRMAEDDKLKLDKLDKLIISSIANNACFDYSKLGKQLEASRNTIKQRVDKLVKKGVILGFRSFINLQKLGYQSNMLFLQINSLDRERETELYYYLRMLPEVSFAVKHIGKWRIGMEIETKESQDFQDLLITLRSNFSDIIADYETFPLIKDHLINYFPSGVLDKC